MRNGIESLGIDPARTTGAIDIIAQPLYPERIQGLRSKMRDAVVSGYLDGTSNSSFILNTYDRFSEIMPDESVLIKPFMDFTRGAYTNLRRYIDDNPDAYRYLFENTDNSYDLLRRFAGNELMLDIEYILQEINTVASGRTRDGVVETEISSGNRLALPKSLADIADSYIPYDAENLFRNMDGVHLAAFGQYSKEVMEFAVGFLGEIGYKLDPHRVRAFIFEQVHNINQGAFYINHKTASIGSRPNMGFRYHDVSMFFDALNTLLHEDRHGKQFSRGENITILGGEVDAIFWSYKVFSDIDSFPLMGGLIDQEIVSRYATSRFYEDYLSFCKLILDRDPQVFLFADHNTSLTQRSNDAFVSVHQVCGEKSS